MKSYYNGISGEKTKNRKKWFSKDEGNPIIMGYVRKIKSKKEKVDFQKMKEILL